MGSALLAGVAPASAAGSPAAALSVSALTFVPTGTSVTPGSTVTLDFTIADTESAATNIGGDVLVNLETSPGKPIGTPFDVPFAYENNLNNGAAYVSGTPQDSTYTYTYVVPRYAASTKAIWGVSEVSVQDSTGASLTADSTVLKHFKAYVQATGETADKTAPTYAMLQYLSDYADSRPYVYDNGVPGQLSYELQVQQDDSGFWQGSLGLSGPGGATLTVPFGVTDYEDQYGCGNYNTEFDSTFTMCSVSATLPAGSPAGTWYVTSVTLTSNVGKSATVSGLQAAPITVTSDSVVSASGFSLSPNPADNWAGSATVEASMDVTGAQDGISAVYVDTDDLNAAGTWCMQTSTTPTVNADGSISVPLRFDQGGPSCQVDGIAIVDGAGNVALYGTKYGASDPGLTLTREPDTTAPTATAASLDVTTLPASQIGQTSLYINATVDTPIAPVNQFSTTVYDSTGTPVPGAEVGGGVSEGLNGAVELNVYLPGGTAAGTYTVGFTITDAGRLSTTYGGPSGQPVPGGPLTLTVTAS